MNAKKQTRKSADVETALAEFLDRTDRGEKLSREDFIASHPEIAEELRSYFDDLETVNLALTETQVGIEKNEGDGEEAGEFPRDFGAYVLLSRIGAGGMGEVFKAQHRHMERLVAIKTLHAQTLDSPDAIQRFHREVKAAAKLSHRNIVTAHDAGEVDGVHFLAMEYVDGQDLHSFVVRRGPLKVPSAVKVVLQAARGLEFAHQQGIIHRDVKPANLLLAKDRTVKLLDLGLARQNTPADGTDVTGEASLTRQGQIMGTVDYMAPEQAADTRQAGVAADIYSLGCTLHYLLTGSSVYSGNTMMKRLLAHREQPIPSLTERRWDVPPALDAVFRKMLAKKPSSRQSSMTQVIAELKETLDSPDTASSTSDAPRPTVDHVPDSGPDASTSDAEASTVTHLAVPLSPAPSPAPTQDDAMPTIRPIAAPKAGRRKPPNRNLLIAAGGLFGLVLLVLAIVISIQTSKGKLVIKVDQAAARILIDGDEVEITADGDPEPITIRVAEGPHRLEVTKGGFVTHTEKFKIVSGEATPVEVELIPLSIASATDKKRVEHSPTDTPPRVAAPQDTGLDTSDVDPAAERAVAKMGSAETAATQDRQAPTPSSLPSSSTSYDPQFERQMAEWVFSKGGQLTVSLEPVAEDQGVVSSAFMASRNNAHKGIFHHCDSFFSDRESLRLADLRAGVRAIPETDFHVVAVYIPWPDSISEVDFQNLGRLPSLRVLGITTRNRQAIDLAGLKHLGGLRHLRALDLTGTALDDGMLGQLCELDWADRLVVLGLTGTLVTDEGLRHVAEMRSLRNLDLALLSVTDSGFAHLRPLKSLESLSLTDTEITEESLSDRRDLDLKHLNISRTDVMAVGLDTLKQFPGLVQLSIEGIGIRDEDLSHLAGLVNLRSLFLAGNRITGSGLQHLKAMSKLNLLDLQDNPIEDSGLQHLKDLPLERLNLWGANVTADGLQHLRDVLSLKNLDLAFVDLGDAELRVLATLPRLEHLNVTGGDFTEEGLMELTKLRR